jgi:hypothetical protein
LTTLYLQNKLTSQFFLRGFFVYFIIYYFCVDILFKIALNLKKNIVPQMVAAVVSATHSAQNMPPTPHNMGKIKANGTSRIIFLNIAINKLIFASVTATNVV